MKTLKMKLERSPRLLFRLALCIATSTWAFTVKQSSLRPKPIVYQQRVTRILGIYIAMPPGAAIPGMPLTANSQPLNLPLTQAATAQLGAQKAADPKDLCQVLGPFRMMSLSGTKFEILRDAPDKLVMLFQKSAWGHVRTISIDSQHLTDYSKVRPMWNGDSIAKWDGDTLVVDTIHFTNKTWLNEAGVTNSRQLHLVEHLRLLHGGRYLKYEATAVDPEVLSRSVTYTRYFMRTDQEITEDDCFARRAEESAHK